MAKEIQEKSCKNCRYYSQHYSKQGIKYSIVWCGHCLKNDIKKRKLVLCRFWEEIAIKKEERKKSIKKTLELMSERLNDIAMILKDDIDY